MQATSIRLYTLNFSDARTYLAAVAFVVGNILLPQLFHLVPQGGMTWLPIYFFTLVGAYKYGWKTGLLTAIASPIVNSFFFGMPMAAALPAILLKSVILALAAGFMAQHYSKVSIVLLAAVVLLYQAIGTLGEWALVGNFWMAIQDFRIGIPGMLLQVFGGYAFIHCFIRK